MIDPQLAAAAAQSELMIAQGQGDAHDHMILALFASARHDHDAAKSFFDQALALDPNDPSVLTGFAKWRRERGDLREAVLACDAAIRIAPEYPDAWLERGAALGEGGSSRASRESYSRAVELAPANAIAWAGLASQATRDGDHASARTAAETALRLDPRNLVAAASLSTVLIHEGDANAARDLLAPLVETTPSSHSRSIAASALGRALEKLKDYRAAYQAYALAKRDFAEAYSPASADDLSQTAFVEAIADAVAALDPAAFAVLEPNRSANAIAPHIFLLGYPRSGTTLLENVLASLPGVAASEEWPTFKMADERYLAGDAASIVSGLQQLAHLDREGRNILRAAYWQQAASSGAKPAAAAFVDMDPLKATRLPFIAALFPQARVLVMRRDPRDVVWSCFKTSFALTSNTLEYTSLERAAQHYDAMMRLTDLALAKLPVQALEVDYRRLTREFDAVTQEICAFTGLEWTPDVRRFDKTAEARGVGTASAAQVRQGLYDGSGQWKPYAEWIEPVLPILAPWIERFGYAD